jgi:hypothetical protein
LLRKNDDENEGNSENDEKKEVNKTKKAARTDSAKQKSNPVLLIAIAILAFCLSLVAFKDQPLLWRSFPADRVLLSEGGAVATHIAGDCSLTTTETELTEGKHYWEVELLSEDVNNIMNNIMIGGVNNIMIGISRPNLDPTKEYYNSGCTDGWFMFAGDGGLFGNGKEGDHGAVAGARLFGNGDRVGVLLDFDNGSLRFFKNGVEHGPGFAASSVTGPVVAAVQMVYKDASVRLLPNAKVPAGV